MKTSLRATLRNKDYMILKQLQDYSNFPSELIQGYLNYLKTASDTFKKTSRQLQDDSKTMRTMKRMGEHLRLMCANVFPDLYEFFVL